jgi:hypothetical protein
LAITVFFATNALTMVLLVFVETYLQERVPADARATGLSLVSFMDTAAIGIAYFGHGALMERFSPGVAISITSGLPALGLVWLGAAAMRKPLPSEVNA